MPGRIEYIKTGEVLPTNKYDENAVAITVSTPDAEFAYDSIAELCRFWRDYNGHDAEEVVCQEVIES